VRVLAILLSFGLLACGSAPAKLVRFQGEPDDALVTVEDQYIGKLGKLEKGGVKLKPGTYRVTVEQVGYFPFDVVVTVPEEGDVEAVEVELEPIPD